MKLMRPFVTTLAALSVAAFLAAPATAQDGAERSATAAAAQEAGWLPLLGCWVAAGETTEKGLLCARPASGGEPGVELVSVVDGETTVTRRILTDGTLRPVRLEGCQGMEQAEISPDGDRLYVLSELDCEGVRRTTTGVISFPSPGQWLDVQAVEVDGRSTAWVQWYSEASDAAVREAGMESLLADRKMAVQSARMGASEPLDADDIVEATLRVDGEAVRALVAQRGEPFDLDAETLIRLDEAGVPSDVIDVMVAVTYPETFAFGDGAVGPADRPSKHVQQLYVDPFYSPYGAYRYWYRRGLYSPWDYYGRHRSYGGYRPAVVVVEPRASRGHGSVEPGRGWSRGSAPSTGRAQPRDRASGSTARSGSSGGSITRSGTRGSGSASSGSSTGRRAKPRGGGGGGEGGGEEGGGGVI